jgi:hypothetical protein
MQVGLIPPHNRRPRPVPEQGLRLSGRPAVGSPRQFRRTTAAVLHVEADLRALTGFLCASRRPVSQMCPRSRTRRRRTYLRRVPPCRGFGADRAFLAEGTEDERARHLPACGLPPSGDGPR